MESILPGSHEQHVRSENISRERSAKSIGLLYYMAAVPFGCSSVACLFAGEQLTYPIGTPVTLGALAVLAGYIGDGLQHLKPWSRVVAIILAVPGLGAFPIGTVMGIYVLYTLTSRQGRRVFSKEYAKVIAETPEMNVQTQVSPIVKGLLVFLGFVLLMILILFLVQGI